MCYNRTQKKKQIKWYNASIYPTTVAQHWGLYTTWRWRKNFRQWERSCLWKLRCHWLKGLRQCQIAVVRQGPVWLQRFGAVRTLLTNGDAAFIWKLCRHWLKGLGTTSDRCRYTELWVGCTLIYWGLNKYKYPLQTIYSLNVLHRNTNFGLVNPCDLFNKSALVFVMVWRQSGDKSLHKPMVTRQLTSHWGQ